MKHNRSVNFLRVHKYEKKRIQKIFHYIKKRAIIVDIIEIGNLLNTKIVKL